MSIQPANPDAADGIHVPLDMGRIVAEATGRPLRQFDLEFSCHGAPWKWSGEAISAAMAEMQGLADLSRENATFNRYKARLVACVER